MPEPGNEEYVPHEDDYPNDPNPPHGVNTEEEMDVGADDDSAS